jgi:DNA-directed RNA polymerase specialized sigma24 family protein
MLDQRRVATQPDEKRERLFTERYESLLAWALRLTNQHHEAAKDLVQDAFVQVMLGRTGLEQIENIDGYLRRSCWSNVVATCANTGSLKRALH